MLRHTRELATNCYVTSLNISPPKLKIPLCKGIPMKRPFSSWEFQWEFLRFPRREFPPREFRGPRAGRSSAFTCSLLCVLYVHTPSLRYSATYRGGASIRPRGPTVALQYCTDTVVSFAVLIRLIGPCGCDGGLRIIL